MVFLWQIFFGEYVSVVSFTTRRFFLLKLQILTKLYVHKIVMTIINQQIRNLLILTE